MVVRTAGHHFDAQLVESILECFGIEDDLLLIGFKGRIERFFEANGLGGNRVHQGAALRAREDGFVNRPGILLFAQDEAAAGATQGFVGGGSHHIRIRNGGFMQAGSNQAGNVGHVCHEHGAHHVRDFAEALEVNAAGIG